MGLLLTAAAASRIEKSGNDLGEICLKLSGHRRLVSGTKLLNGSERHITPKGEALSKARRWIADAEGVRSVDVLVWCADGSVDLLRVGRKGGWKRVTRIWDKDGQPC
jgi:hypothetical protein